MSSNLTPGRKKDRVEIYSQAGESDEWGVPSDGTLITTLACDVRVRSGDQNERYGVDVNSEIITVLCDMRPTVQPGMDLKWINKKLGGQMYVIRHIKPGDHQYKSMIITAEMKANG